MEAELHTGSVTTQPSRTCGQRGGRTPADNWRLLGGGEEAGRLWQETGQGESGPLLFVAESCRKGEVRSGQVLSLWWGCDILGVERSISLEAQGED